MSLLVSIIGLVSWSFWGYTVITISPETPIAPLAFYGSLFVALTCTIARLREAPGYEDRDGNKVGARPAVGHAAAATTLLLFALWLQSLRMLSSLNVMLLCSAMLFVEVGFVLTGRQHRSGRRTRPTRLASGAPAGPPEQ